MTAVDRIADVFNAAALGGAALAAALLLAKLSAIRPRPLHLLALLVLIVSLAIDVGFSFYDASPWADLYPAFTGASLLIWPLLPVSLWFYVKGLTEIAPRLRRRDARHLVPIALNLIVWLPFLTLDDARKRGFVADRIDFADPHQFAAALGSIVFVLLWVGQLAIYGIAIGRRLRDHRRRVRQLCSDVARIELRWLGGFMAFIGLIIIIAILDQLWPLAAGRQLLMAWWSAAFEAAILLGLGFFGLQQGPAMPDWADEAQDIEGQASDEAPQPYARSPLAEADCDLVIAKLDLVMRREALWRDPFLTLKSLSERAGTKPYYVSQALNTRLDRNFYDYVNGWRIAAARRALLDSDNTILAICEQSGFNSKSTFNSVFRRETGMTPSAYRISRPAQGAEPT